MMRFFGEISDAGIDLPCVSIGPRFFTDGIKVAIDVEIEGDVIAHWSAGKDCWAWGGATSREDTVLRFKSTSSMRANRVDISVVNDVMRRSILRRRMLAGVP